MGFESKDVMLPPELCQLGRRRTNSCCQRPGRAAEFSWDDWPGGDRWDICRFGGVTSLIVIRRDLDSDADLRAGPFVQSWLGWGLHNLTLFYSMFAVSVGLLWRCSESTTRRYWSDFALQKKQLSPKPYCVFCRRYSTHYLRKGDAITLDYNPGIHWLSCSFFRTPSNWAYSSLLTVTVNRLSASFDPAFCDEWSGSALGVFRKSIIILPIWTASTTVSFSHGKVFKTKGITRNSRQIPFNSASQFQSLCDHLTLHYCYAHIHCNCQLN